jgi:hypothetical protein
MQAGITTEFHQATVENSHFINKLDFRTDELQFVKTPLHMPEPNFFMEPGCRCNATTTVVLRGNDFQKNVNGIKWIWETSHAYG